MQQLLSSVSDLCILFFPVYFQYIIFYGFHMLLHADFSIFLPVLHNCVHQFPVLFIHL